MPNSAFIPVSINKPTSNILGNVLIFIKLNPDGTYDMWINGESYVENANLDLILKILDWIRVNLIKPPAKPSLSLPGNGSKGGQLIFG